MPQQHVPTTNRVGGGVWSPSATVMPKQRVWTKIRLPNLLKFYVSMCLTETNHEFGIHVALAMMSSVKHKIFLTHTTHDSTMDRNALLLTLVDESAKDHRQLQLA